VFYEPGRGQLHTEPHIRQVYCRITSIAWQEPEKELNKLLTNVSGRDLNVNVKINTACVEPNVDF